MINEEPRLGRLGGAIAASRAEDEKSDLDAELLTLVLRLLHYISLKLGEVMRQPPKPEESSPLCLSSVARN